MRLEATFATAAEFLARWEEELSNGALLLRPAPAGVAPGARCTVAVRLDTDEVEATGTVMAVGRTGATVAFDEVPEELAYLVDRLRNPTPVATAPVAPAPATTTVAQRLSGLTVAQKMAAALSGDRDTRLALLRDNVKAIHVYVLKNPRIQLDEVQFAAKMNTLSPDAIDFIARHHEWGSNATIVSALVRNPKTPVPLALRLLPKSTPAELRTIAKGGAREQLVQAARRLING